MFEQARTAAAEAAEADESEAASEPESDIEAIDELADLGLDHDHDHEAELGEEGEETIAAVAQEAALKIGADGTATRLKVKAGMWHQLGASPANPAGLGALKTVGEINQYDGASSGTGKAALVAADYELDMAAGRILVKKAAADGKFIEVMGTLDGRVIKQAKASAAASQITCAVRYVEVDGLAGGATGRNVYARKVNLIPGGEAALKSRDTEQQMAFTGTVLDSPDEYPSLVVDGVER